MSMFGDYKSYRRYLPQYPEWKNNRDLLEAKRQEYLRLNPTEINHQDIQKSKTLLRAIDIMDEYSQKRAEDMEVLAESVVSMGLEIAAMLGAGLGFLVTQLAPVKNLLKKHAGDNKKLATMTAIGSMVAGGLLGSLAAFPLYSWAAKAEVKASRKGRFEAMRKELDDPRFFAVLSPQQEEQLKTNLEQLNGQKKKKKPFTNFIESWQSLKEMATDSREYLLQRMEFEKSLEEDLNRFDEEVTPLQIENAKKDQQLLTKLVEKIDIASQDYAENAELASSAVITTAFAFGGLFTLGYEKLAKHFKWKQSNVPAGTGMVLMLLASIFAASIQKQASRVGRFVMKQELEKNPEQLVYVSDEKTGEIVDVHIDKQEKQNIFVFLRDAWKNNNEFEKWKKTEGAKEKNLSKAYDNISLTEEQLQNAKRLQHNTFKTFNKIDENSQKYSESIEALGQAIQYPVSIIFSTLGVLIGSRYLARALKDNAKDMAIPMMKYMSIVFLSTLPSIGINAYLTKEQKKASRVADMLAINELSDYRNFL